MKLHVYSIFDAQSQTFSPPFICHNDELAIRFVRDEVAVPGSVLSKYPVDFNLYRIGVWYPSVELPLCPFEPETSHFVSSISAILGADRVD